jgi:hypothetical protein
MVAGPFALSEIASIFSGVPSKVLHPMLECIVSPPTEITPSGVVYHLDPLFMFPFKACLMGLYNTKPPNDKLNTYLETMANSILPMDKQGKQVSIVFRKSLNHPNVLNRLLTVYKPSLHPASDYSRHVAKIKAFFEKCDALEECYKMDSIDQKEIQGQMSTWQGNFGFYFKANGYSGCGYCHCAI